MQSDYSNTQPFSAIVYMSYGTVVKYHKITSPSKFLDWQKKHNDYKNLSLQDGYLLCL